VDKDHKDNTDDYIIVIDGEEIEMEIRECAGGCGRTFKVSKNSTNYFAFSDCAERCFGHKVSKHQHKKHFNPHHSSTSCCKDWVMKGTENEEQDYWD
jgi:hypothetical protein